MQSKKVFIAFLAPALLAFTVHTAIAADDDGTFTINLQGPDEVAQTTQVPEASSAQATPSNTRNTARNQNTRRLASQNRANPNRASQNRSTNTTRNTQTDSSITTLPAATPQRPVVTNSDPLQAQSDFSVAPQGTYNVGSNDTLWSIATRYMPADRSVNEFQIAASIYRRNPNAFIGGNVNRLRAGRITIPALADMAREDERTGSQLLRQGSINLPSLQAPQRQSQNVATSAVTTPTASTSNNTQSRANNLPVYQATENLVRNARLERQKELEDQARAQLNLAALGAQRGAEVANDSVTNAAAEASRRANGEQNPLSNAQQESQASNVNQAENTDAKEQGENDVTSNNEKNGDKSALEHVQEQNTQTVELTPHASPKDSQNVDSQALKIMLDGAQKQIDLRMREINSRLMDTIERMQKSNDTVSSSTQEAVANLAKQYDGLIAELQQNVTELKGQVASLSRDMSNMREMLLASDEKIESMQVSLADGKFSNQQDKSNSYRTSYNYLVAGIGCLTLMLLILFLVVRSKSRARSRALQKDLSEIDASAVAHDEELLSSTVGLDENEMQKNWSDALAEVEPESKQDQAKKDTSQAILEKAVKGDTALDSAETDAAVAAGEKIAENPSDSESSNESDHSDAQTQENGSNSAKETANETQDNTDALSTEDAWAAALKEQSDANQEHSEQENSLQETSSEQSKNDSSNSEETVDKTTPKDAVTSEETNSLESEQKSNAEQISVDDDLSKYIGASGSEWAQQVKEGEESDPNLQASNQASLQTNSASTNSASNDEPQLKEQDLADAWAQALAQQNADTKNYDVENEQLSTEQAQGDEEHNPKADASVTSEVSDASENQLTQDSDAETEDSDTFTQVLNSLQSKEDAVAEGNDKTSDESESYAGEEQSSKESFAKNLETNSEPSEDEKSLSQALSTKQYTNDISNDLDESNTEHSSVDDVVQDHVKDSSDSDIQKLASYDVMPQDGFVQDDQVDEKAQKQEFQDQDVLTASGENTDEPEDAGKDADSDDQTSDEETFAEVLKNLQAQNNEEITDIASHEDQSLSTEDEHSTQGDTEHVVESEDEDPQQEVETTETDKKNYSAESSDSSDNDDSEDAQIFAHVRDLLSSGDNSNEKVGDQENEEQTNDAQNQDDHQTFNDLVKKLSEFQDEDVVSKVQNSDEILGEFNVDDEKEVANTELSSNEDEQQNLAPSLEEHEDQQQAGVSSDTTSPTPVEQDSDQAIFSEVLNNLKDQNDDEDQDSYSSSTMADSYDPSWDEEHTASSVSSDEEEHDVQTSAEYSDNDELSSTEFKERPQQVAERLFSADFLSGLPSLDEESQSSEQIESLSAHDIDENTSTTQDQENTNISDDVTANLADSVQENAQLVSDTQKENINDTDLKMHDDISSVSQSEPEMKTGNDNNPQLHNEDVYAETSYLEEKDVQENKNIDEKDSNLEKELDKHQNDSNEADLEHDVVAQASLMQHEGLADGQNQEQQSQEQQSQEQQSQEQQSQEQQSQEQQSQEQQSQDQLSQSQDGYEQNESIKSQALLEDNDQNSLNIPEHGTGDQVDFNVENNSEAHTQTDAKESLSTEPLADPKAYEQSQSNDLDKDDALHDLENKDQAQIEQQAEASTTEDTNTVVNSDLVENAEHELVTPELSQNTEQGSVSKAQVGIINEDLNEIATQSDAQSQVQHEQVDIAKDPQAEPKDNAQHYSEEESPLLNANDAKWNIPDEQEFGIDNTDENINDVDFKETSALQDRELFSGNEILQSIENEELPPDLPQETDQQQANYSPFTWKVPDEEEFDVTTDPQQEVSKSNSKQKIQSTSSAQEHVNSEPRGDFEHRAVEERNFEKIDTEQKQSQYEAIEPDELTAKVTNADIDPVSSDSESTGLQEHDIMNMLSEGLGEKELDDDVGQVDEAVAADVKSELDDDDILRMLSNSQEHLQEQSNQDKDHS